MKIVDWQYSELAHRGRFWCRFMARQEQAYLKQVLTACHDDKEKAAKALEVSLSTLCQKLRGDTESLFPSRSRSNPA